MSKLSYTIPEAAVEVGVTDLRIRKAIHSGALKAKRESENADGEGVGKYLVLHADLQSWLKSLTDA